jgi:hypothetical protein
MLKENVVPIPSRQNLYSGFFQIAYVTNSTEEAIETYRLNYGVERFLTVPLTFTVNTPGGLKTANIKASFAYVGETQIELIEPVGGNLTLYSEALPAGNALALRLHHIACRLPTREQWDKFRSDLDTTLHPIVIESTLPQPETKYLYTDERARLGHYCEYMWLDASASAMFDAVPRN